MSDDNEQDRRWLAVGEALLRAAGAAEEPAVPGGRLYQFGVDFTFVTPCVLVFDDQISSIEASVAIVGPTGVEYSDVAAVPADDVPAVRGWSASLIGQTPGDRHGNWRDGVVCFVRVIGRGRLAWTWVENPTPDHHPTFAAVLAGMADVALRSFPREPVRSYLENVLRPLRRPRGPSF